MLILSFLGADPANGSAEGTPEQLTSDATILGLIASAKEKRIQADPANATYYTPDGYSQDYSSDPSKAYYAHPHGSYMYYPPIHPGAAMVAEGAVPYYPPPPPPPPPVGETHSDGNGGSNLPPPEIARLIPCR